MRIDWEGVLFSFLPKKILLPARFFFLHEFSCTSKVPSVIRIPGSLLNSMEKENNVFTGLHLFLVELQMFEMRANVNLVPLGFLLK